MPLLLAGSAFGAVLLAVFLAGTVSHPDKKKKRGVGADATDFIDANFSLADHLRDVGEQAANLKRTKVQGSVTFFDRVVKRVLDKALERGRALTPTGYIDKCAHKLQHAGRRGPEELDKFIAMRALTAALGVVFAILTFITLQGISLIPLIGNRTNLALFGLGTLFLIFGPDATLNRAADQRRLEVRRSLPDVLDLLTISVEAGLGFEQAIQYVCDSMDGALSEEFNRMNAEMRAGATRADAMKALDERVDVEEVKLFVLAIVQADRFGVSIARILRGQAEEMRIKRHQLAQEMAQKAPVKMLIPMTFFIFPPLFIVVLGPALMNIAVAFGS